MPSRAKLRAFLHVSVSACQSERIRVAFVSLTFLLSKFYFVILLGATDVAESAAAIPWLVCPLPQSLPAQSRIYQPWFSRNGVIPVCDKRGFQC